MALAAHVVEVTTHSFAVDVLERSRQTPVLVDFWAAWCGPCRQLGPVLEKLAAELKGAFVLAKVDTEANPELAAEFGIRGIPAVKLFRDGQIVDEFVGALPEPAVREFLGRHCQSPADRLVAEALDFLSSGYRTTAEERLEAALALEPEHAVAHLERAKLAFADGDSAAVSRHVAAIPVHSKEADEAQSLNDALALVADARAIADEAECRRRLEQNPDDLEARFALGAWLVGTGQYQAALDEFLAVVAKNKKFRDEAARKAMITIFGLIGVRSELAAAYRRKLSIYL